MKISLSWLNEWVDIEDIDVEDLSHSLTMAGLEVEAVDYIGYAHDDIVVGEIISIGEHPKADRLVLCEVNVGDESPRQIVCGAKNMSAGDKVPVALAGSRPPGVDFDIVERKVMGVLSQGMMCSEEELNLARESEGLLILDADAPIGQAFYDALGLKDVVITIGLTPNRSDCLSHLGVARDICALYGKSLKKQLSENPTGLEVFSEQSGVNVSQLQIVDVDGCPRYGLASIDGITVGKSPLWLRHRLNSVGVRTVNNVVDMTNFVMFDIGQPLHAFDRSKITDGKIVVRRANAGEKIVGIDHREYSLDGSDLVIADNAKAVAIAGVMGGADTEVSDETTSILLECAYFEPRTVRRTAKKLALHSESSHRFERNIDAEATALNLRRALDVLSLIHTEQPLIINDVLIAQKQEVIHPGHIIELPKATCSKILGTIIPEDSIVGYLQAIGLRLIDKNDHWQVHAPSFRDDLSRPIDLVEEVARLHGYDKIAPALPAVELGREHKRRISTTEAPTIISREKRRQLSRLRTALLDIGLFEVVNYSFMAENALEELSISDKSDLRCQLTRVANPLVKEQAAMRTTLIPGLLANYRHNCAQRNSDMGLFEIGRRYLTSGEPLTLGVLLSGVRTKHWSGQTVWDFYDAKGLIEALVSGFEIPDMRWVAASDDEQYFHPGVKASLYINDDRLADVGQLHPRIAQKQGFDQAVYLIEMNFDILLNHVAKTDKLEPITRYPSVTRDFAFLVDSAVEYEKIEQLIEKLSVQEKAFGDILESTQLFDVYQGEQVPQGKKSLALQVIYRCAEKTLTDDLTASADNALVTALSTQLGAQLR